MRPTTVILLPVALPALHGEARSKTSAEGTPWFAPRRERGNLAKYH